MFICLMCKIMNIELINWTEETGGRIVKIDCKINQKFKSFYVLDVELKKVFIEYFEKDWKERKVIFDKYHKLFFIKHFFTI